MKIIDKFKRKETAYRYVDAGTVFKYGDDYYMATEEITSKHDNVYNCVNLDSGELLCFVNGLMVEVLEAELNVK